MSMHPNGSVWDSTKTNDMVRGANGEFTVYGDLHKAYEVLKDMFEPKPKKSGSGPIRPITQTEKTIEDNRYIADTLEDIPPQHYS